jgi:hypothetical protein
MSTRAGDAGRTPVCGTRLTARRTRGSRDRVAGVTDRCAWRVRHARKSLRMRSSRSGAPCRMDDDLPCVPVAGKALCTDFSLKSEAFANECGLQPKLVLVLILL